MTRILIVRHAEAEGNLYRGSTLYDSRLTADGFRQLNVWQNGLKAKKIDAVYASGSYRTRTTARRCRAARPARCMRCAPARESAWASGGQTVGRGHLPPADMLNAYNTIRKAGSGGKRSTPSRGGAHARAFLKLREEPNKTVVTSPPTAPPSAP
jgi:hypothetical protein